MARPAKKILNDPKKVVAEMIEGLVLANDGRVAKLPNGGEVSIASLARALMDAVYDWDRYNTLPRAFTWIAARKDDKDLVKDLVHLALQHGNAGTMRRIGYILEANGVSTRLTSKLKAAVSKTRSLVPLIPTRPARGDIDRTWGVIDNDRL